MALPRGSSWIRAVIAAVALVGLGSAAGAQPREPIYIQYDGYVKNKDGTFTLSFGYFNTNRVDVSIPAGPDNAFLPDPADRGQPTTFLAGRHRFACSVVEKPDFDGRIQWQVRFAGTASTSTAKVLDPLYELELASQKRATSGLETEKAARSVCVNRAPSVTVLNPFGDINAGAAGLEATSFVARPDQEVTLTGNVEDDGLPRGGKVTVAWKQVSGPAPAAFTTTSAPATRVRFAAPGAYELELAATDGQLDNSVKVKVTVRPAEDSK
jgi:K319-like protein